MAGFETDLVIVGGGLAGLAAAERAQTAGLSFLLLEARTRLGGRILGPPLDPVAPSSPRFDLGPAWFWPGQRRIAALAETLGIPVFAQHSVGRSVFQDARGAVRRDLEMALNPEGLRLDGGFGRLIEGLAARLPAERLRLSADVRRVARRGAGWRVEAETQEGALSIETAAVILALPPRLAAARIEAPEISDRQRAALSRPATWMAAHAKAMAVYARPFWRAMGLSGDAISQRGPLAQIHDASPRGAEVGALFGFVGPSATARARVGEEALRAAVLDQLVALFGAEAAVPAALWVQDWSREAFTAAEADLDAPPAHPLYGPEPSLAPLAEAGLLFAGTESVREDGGLLEGALASAERAMGQALAARGG